MKTARPLDVYNNMIPSDDVRTAPRDSRVIRNKKMNDRRRNNIENGGPPCATFADKFQIVFRMMMTDNFICRVIGQSDSAPNVILYNDRQIHEIAGFCFSQSCGSVLGFDKTFNLGAIYVTVSVYKNMALTRKATMDVPIFIGPIFPRSFYYCYVR